jgi:hexosaminidase
LSSTTRRASTFRGLHVDVARNFHSKAEILAILDQMAAYKLNRLHLHLADDEGWRVEIAGLPELTTIGSRRCHDLAERTCLLPQLGAGPDPSAPVNGFYSRADYIEIVRAAQARHIQVIPSFDMPGHSRAAIKAMEARAARLRAEGKPEAEAGRYLLSEAGNASVYSSIQHYRRQHHQRVPGQRLRLPRQGGGRDGRPARRRRPAADPLPHRRRRDARGLERLAGLRGL